jgi:hypothetical protein
MVTCFRYNGTKLRSSTVSRQIGLFCSNFFGVFLNVTTLRAINNTAVKNAAAHGVLNHTQLEEYNIECQGHTTRMGRKAYDTSLETDRAKTLQHINDTINIKYREKLGNENVDHSGGSDISSDDDTSDVELCTKKRKRDY